MDREVGLGGGGERAVPLHRDYRGEERGERGGGVPEAAVQLEQPPTAVGQRRAHRCAEPLQGGLGDLPWGEGTRYY